jgi:hypothetical protein
MKAVVGDPIVLAIVMTTLAGFGLRMFYLLHGEFLLGVTEYDDGSYFGSAIRLTQGILPYRDFVFVQPPGIALLMLPSALLAHVTGSAWGLASGRILTVLAGTASVALMGLLVRHRGLFVTVVACGVAAVYPDAVAAAHTVLVEPWLVLFCLVGLVLVFDGDGLADRPRGLLWGGIALGFAGAVEAWAIVPVVMLLVMCAVVPLRGRRWPGRIVPFAVGVAAGFLVPVAPFAAAAPRGFYQSLIVAQIGPRQGAIRAGLLGRLHQLTGLRGVDLTSGPPAPSFAVWALAIILVLIVAGVPGFLLMIRSQAPTVLEWFALVCTELIVAMLLWPDQFHYHFAAFLAPFLGLAVALALAGLFRPADRAATGGSNTGSPGVGSGPAGHSGSVHGKWRPRLWTLAAILVALMTVIQAINEGSLPPVVPPSALAQANRLVPQGSCVVTDNAALLLLADRFTSSAPGCTVIDDGRGTDLALSGGLTPETGAGLIPAVARLWRRSFSHAQFLWLTHRYPMRVAGTPALWRYVHRHFALIFTDSSGDRLYRRIHRHHQRRFQGRRAGGKALCHRSETPEGGSCPWSRSPGRKPRRRRVSPVLARSVNWARISSPG